MKTEVIRITDLSRDFAGIKRAADVLKNGGLAVLPTETVYGIAANALDPAAVSGIFAAKGRPQDNPLIVHVSRLDEIPPLVLDFPQQAKYLAAAFWPGPLTMILPKSCKIPQNVSADLDTVAVRMPSHPVIRAVIAESGLPLAAPSANLSGRPSPTSANHCVQDLDGRVDLILDGGDCFFGLESTVVTLVTNPPRLLRPGAVTLEQLQEILGDVETDVAVLSKIPDDSGASSPGMKYKHYAPSTKITLVHGSFENFARYAREKDASAGLVFDGEETLLPFPCLSYGKKDDFAEQGRLLFARLRELDYLGVKDALARPPEPLGPGLAVYNRLIRAAGFDEIYL